MLPKEIFKKVRQIEIRTNREVTDVLGGSYHSVFKGRGMEFEEVREYLPGDVRPGNRMTLDVPPDATIAEIVAPFNLPPKLVHLVLINGFYVPPAERAARRLAEGDTLAIWPPIAGG